ncbi:hypothetical protein AMS58_05690 [Pseudoalteromonas porphyrae]|nr:hypothetical protein AMS58_05690 [Pseudoalteromonas porphyrae]
MTAPMVQLAFALQSYEDPLSAAMAHTTEYDPLILHANSDHKISFLCVLPDDAHEGDIISLSATHLAARNARYFVTYTLKQADLEQSTIILAFDKVTCSDDYVLQMMLHGLHATLKDSAQFDVSVNAFKCGYVSDDPTPLALTKSLSFRQYLSSFSSSFLSFF